MFNQTKHEQSYLIFNIDIECHRSERLCNASIFRSIG